MVTSSLDHSCTQSCALSLPPSFAPALTIHWLLRPSVWLLFGMLSPDSDTHYLNTILRTPTAMLIVMVKLFKPVIFSSVNTTTVPVCCIHYDPHWWGSESQRHSAWQVSPKRPVGPEWSRVSRLAGKIQRSKEFTRFLGNLPDRTMLHQTHTPNSKGLSD